MRLRILIGCFLLLVPLFSMAQNRANNWIWGTNLSLDFNQNPPEFLNLRPFYRNLSQTGNISPDYPSSVSDAQGNLLFFVVNGHIHRHIKDPNPIPLHHDSIASEPYSGGVRGVLNNLIVPSPKNNRYYILTMVVGDNYKHRLYFHIFEVNGPKDSGRLISNANLAQENLSQGMAATLHGNGDDYWIMTYNTKDKQYQAFLLDENGLQDPVNSKAGQFFIDKYHWSKMKFSPDGNKLGFVMNNEDSSSSSIEISKFNLFTGKIKEGIQWTRQFENEQRNHIGYDDLAFAPCGNNLYLVIGNSTPFDPRQGIFQYSLDSFERNVVRDSRYKLPHSRKLYNYRALQLGPNGKLYHAGGWSGTIYETLEVIHNPNQDSSAINFDSTFINFDTISLRPVGHQIYFPHFPSNYFRHPLIDYASTLCINDTATFTFKNPCLFDSARWHFDDPASGNNIAHTFNARHRFSDTGTYQTRVVGWKDSIPDTAYKMVRVTPGKQSPGFLSDTTLCKPDSLILRAQTDSGTYHWPNHSSDTLVITSNDTLHYSFQDQCRQIRDTIIIRFHNPTPDLQLPEDTTICHQQSFTLKPDSVREGYEHLWSTGAKSPRDTLSQTGTYWLEAQNACGTARDSIRLDFFGKLTLQDTFSLCRGDTIHPEFRFSDSLRFEWSTGSSHPFIVPDTSGQFWLKLIHPECGAVYDTFRVTMPAMPPLSLPADTSACQGDPVLLKAADGYDDYLWSNGATGQSIQIREGGSRTLKARKRGCDTSHTINVNILNPPDPGLPTHDTICSNEDIYTTLEANATHQHHWEPGGSSGQTLEVREPGTYMVTTTDPNGCQATDTTEVHEFCEGKMYFPNAFKPGSKQGNDEFRPVGTKAHDYRLKIYNRWGEKIFETTDPNEGWDGTYKGQRAPVGIYIYVCSYKLKQPGGYFEIKSKEGVLKLLR